MTEDVVRSLGHLTLGTRLKRISERVLGQTQVLLAAKDIRLTAAFCPLLAALDRLGALTIGELSQAVGVSQPAITRMAAKLKAEGLVIPGPATTDGRRRPIMLTPAGRDLIGRAQTEVWGHVESAVADACAGLSGPLLAQLTGLEQALAAESLVARAARLTAQDLDRGRA